MPALQFEGFDKHKNMQNDPSQSVTQPAWPQAGAPLEDVARRWRAAGATLPAPVLDWVFAAIARSLASADPDRAALEAEAASAWPPGWARGARAAGATAALELLEGECLAVLAQDPMAGPRTVSAVHEAFALARRSLIAQAIAPAGPSTQNLQQALAARDRQLSVATHELRTPISSILLNLEMLERTARKTGRLDAETVTRLLAVPLRQLRRLTRMVDLLLDAAQVENERLVLHPQAVDLCQLIHEATTRLQPLARSAGCTIDLQECEPVIGHWDRLRLEQVVTNLITNAIKYGGGQVKVATHGGAEATLVVRDDGDGIPAEDQARIFEPYERLPSTSSEDGAGLGLYIVREIVRAHGGRIAVDSQPGEGATFTIHLPIQKQEQHSG